MLVEKTKPVLDGQITIETSSPFFVVEKIDKSDSFISTLLPDTKANTLDVAEQTEAVEVAPKETDDKPVYRLNYEMAREQGRPSPSLLELQRQQRSHKMQTIMERHRQERQHQEAKKQTRWRRLGAIGLCAAGLVLGVAEGPQAFGQPSVESTVGRALEGWFINQVGGPQIYQQAADQAAIDRTSVNGFIISNEARLKKIQASDTFVPEQFLPAGVTNALAYIQTPAGEINQQRTLNTLETEVNVWGVPDIRLPIEWSSTIGADGNFSLAYYQPYISFLESAKNPVTGKKEELELNVGPTKSANWPESHIPPKLSNPDTGNTSLVPEKTLPPEDTVITPDIKDQEFIQKAKLWLNTLMQQLVEYKDIENFQLDNEPLNAFGPEQWTMSAAWENVLEKIVLSYRPNASFLINVAGTGNIARSVDIKNPPNLFKAIGEVATLLQLEKKFSEQSVIQEMLDYRDVLMGPIKAAKGKGNVVIGFDSYHFTSNTPLPIQEDMNGKKYEVWVDTDTLIEATEALAGDPNPWVKLQSNNVPYQITEMQTEDWSPYTSPGNNPKELLFEIERALRVLPPNQISTMGYWRISPLIYNLLYNPHYFYSNADPKKMTDPAGQFTANDQTMLDIVAATTGVSRVETSHGKKIVNNTTVDTFMNQTIQAGNSGSVVSAP